MSSLEAIFGHEQARPQADADAPTPPRAEARVEQLLALNKAAVAITGELELDNLLQRIVDTARELVGCKYVALGVLGEDGYIVRFPTSGISDTEREKIGAPPRGHGLLGVMLRAGRSHSHPRHEQGPPPRRLPAPPPADDQPAGRADFRARQAGGRPLSVPTSLTVLSSMKRTSGWCNCWRPTRPLPSPTPGCTRRMCKPWSLPGASEPGWTLCSR